MTSREHYSLFELLTEIRYGCLTIPGLFMIADKLGYSFDVYKQESFKILWDHLLPIWAFEPLFNIPLALSLTPWFRGKFNWLNGPKEFVLNVIAMRTTIKTIDFVCFSERTLSSMIANPDTAFSRFVNNISIVLLVYNLPNCRNAIAKLTLIFWLFVIFIPGGDKMNELNMQDYNQFFRSEFLRAVHSVFSCLAIFLSYLVMLFCRKFLSFIFSLVLIYSHLHYYSVSDSVNSWVSEVLLLSLSVNCCVENSQIFSLITQLILVLFYFNPSLPGGICETSWFIFDFFHLTHDALIVFFIVSSFSYKLDKNFKFVFTFVLMMFSTFVLISLTLHRITFFFCNLML